jgi:hypothetical protein
MRRRLSQSVFGTTEWRSYALYNAGTHCEESGDDVSAEKLYVAALAIDPKNFAARMNLGGLLVDSGSEARGIEQLVIAKHAAIDDGRVENDAVYYSASARLAAAFYNAGRTADAKVESELLLDKIQASLGALNNPPMKSRFGRWVNAARRWPGLGWLARRIGDSMKANEVARLQPLRRYLEQVQQTVEIIHLGLTVASGQPVRRLLLGDSGWSPSAPYQYNLACTLSVMAAHATDRKISIELEGDALAHLDLSLRLEPRMAVIAPRDESLAHLRTAKAAEFQKLLVRWAKPSSQPAATSPAAQGANATTPAAAASATS